MRLLDKTAQRGDSDGEPPHTLASANYILDCYGVHEFLADLDARREYWRDTACPITGEATVVGSCLSWMVEGGFKEFIGQFLAPDSDIKFSTAEEWRSRYFLQLLKATNG